jgi:hypothetical protein
MIQNRFDVYRPCSSLSSSSLALVERIEATGVPPQHVVPVFSIRCFKGSRSIVPDPVNRFGIQRTVKGLINSQRRDDGIKGLRSFDYRELTHWWQMSQTLQCGPQTPPSSPVTSQSVCILLLGILQFLQHLFNCSCKNQAVLHRLCEWSAVSLLIIGEGRCSSCLNKLISTRKRVDLPPLAPVNACVDTYRF